MRSTTPDRTRLAPSGNPVVRPADKPDAMPPGIGSKQDVGDTWHDSMRGVDIGNNELTFIETLLAALGGGENVARLAAMTHRARYAERREVRAELTDKAALAEQVAEARADERCIVEAEARQDWAVARAEIEAEHAAELGRIRSAWSGFVETVGGP